MDVVIPRDNRHMEHHAWVAMPVCTISTDSVEGGSFQIRKEFMGIMARCSTGKDQGF